MKMSVEPESWHRRNFVDGGGEPFLFYVVYGKINHSAPLSRSRYRSQGLPTGLSMMAYGPEKHREVPGSFREGFLWDELKKSNPDLAEEIRQCDRCIVVRGTPEDSTSLNFLRDTVGLIMYLLDNGGCGVYDPQMLRWWSCAEWQQKLFTPAQPMVQNHSVILVSEEDDPALKWYHTRGMRKFGRPDISVHNVPAELADGVVDLVNRLIEHLASGHVIADGQQIRMPSLPLGTIARNGGDLDDPDFNNVHIDIQLGKP